LRLLDDREVRALEPHAAGVAGLHVPEEGIVDYAAVCGTLRRLVEERGGALLLGARVNAIARRANQWTLETNASPVTARILVNAAGLHADRVARLAGERPIVRIIPFRGEYWQLAPTRTHLVRNLIYPVPNPSLPFLGVHFTRRITGGVEAGPNAVLALSREGYRRSQANLRDLAGVLLFPGLWRFLARYPRTTVHELARSFSKALFVRSLRRLVPEISAADLVPGPSGVRAQAMRPDGTLVEDFELIVRPNAVHVLNAPSPAATASLAIGGEIADLVSGIGR
jgi:L-2-hydroxyglutarate oxidase